MSLTVSVATFDWSSSSNAPLLAIPDRCPVCHHSVDPRRIGGGMTSENQQELEFVFQCPRTRCRSHFIGYYYRGGGGYDLRRTAPWNAAEQTFPPEVETVSPTFVIVYNQAIAAEAAHLDQLTGIGLRKALEFLVKDFAIAEHPDSAEKIKRAPLAACIREYIEDPNLRSTATRAAWLGNDETHYLRKWEDRDIRDLKVLITLAVNWTQNVLLTRKYQEEMAE